MATHDANARSGGMPPPPWKVGELAGRTGLSVRALHHYDEIGLLRPSRRTPSGHRLSTHADVERLQRIQSLRVLALSLDEVKRVLDGAALSPRQLIDVHLAGLRRPIARQTRLAGRLEALAHHLDAADVVSLDNVCRIIEDMTTMDQIPTIAAAVQTMYQHKGPVLAEKRGEVPTPDMFEYMGQAFAAMKG